MSRPHPATQVSDCKHCGSTALSWTPHNITRSGIQNGRLKTSEVECLFVLGCDHCSETLGAINADQVAAMMNGKLLRFTGWTACSERLPDCPHDDNDGMLSDSLLVCDANEGQNLGMAHLVEGAGWVVYGGEHDFMHPEHITHWMPFPESPVREAARAVAKAGEVQA